MYSDRYFRYGLPLLARPAPARQLVADLLGAGATAERARPRRAHVMPLRSAAPRPAPRALLQVPPRPAEGRAPPVAPAERLLRLCDTARFEEDALDAARAGPGALRRRALDYRQGAGGVWPRVGAGRGARPAAPLPAPEPERSTRPQFALDEAEEAGPETERSRAYSLYERLSKASARLSANLAPAATEGDKTHSMALARKVLNTERYNNGARALRRGSGGGAWAGGGAWLGAGDGARGARQLRATIRAMLAFSSLFYALSFLAFYFLSLP